MERNAKSAVIAVILIFLAAFGGYIYGGNERQKTLDRDFQLLNYSEWATEVKANIRLLELIDKKRYQEAKNLLSRFLDIRLASLGKYDRFAKDYPNNDIFAAIAAARKYREQHPSSKVNPELEKGVMRALKITATD